MGFCPFSEIHKLYPRKENHVNPMIDLVADLGEGFGAYTIGYDSELLEIVQAPTSLAGSMPVILTSWQPQLLNASAAGWVSVRTPAFPT